MWRNHFFRSAIAVLISSPIVIYSLIDFNADDFYRAAVLLIFAMLFDLLDGRVARMTKTQSAFGLQLDSLADLMTIAPAERPAFYALLQTRFDRIFTSEDVTADDVFMGNGVSECIDLTLRALLNSGDEILLPSPDYPRAEAWHREATRDSKITMANPTAMAESRKSNGRIGLNQRGCRRISASRKSVPSEDW